MHMTITTTQSSITCAASKGHSKAISIPGCLSEVFLQELSHSPEQAAGGLSTASLHQTHHCITGNWLLIVLFCASTFSHPDYTVGPGITPVSCLAAHGLA
jgi:hypothetical protein